MSPLVLHIPHASRTIPQDVRSLLLPDGDTIGRELLLLTDAWTDEIVAEFDPEAERVLFPVSRLVVDPEQFPHDADEPMAAHGMGAVYTKLSSGERLRANNKAERRRPLETYYRPHHARLESAVGEALTQFGRCLIVDVHSFSSMPLPHEPDQTVPRPEVCIGFDRFHSPFREAEEIRRICEAKQFSAGSIDPSGGASCLQRYWSADARVRSFMLEIRRDLYMDEATGNKRADFSAASRRLCSLIEALAPQWASARTMGADVAATNSGIDRIA